MTEIFKITPYFNEAMGGSFHTAKSKKLHENWSLVKSGIPMMEGFRVGDPLYPSLSIGEERIPGETVEEALETLFLQMNADTRPNGRNERSLSVGDVARVRYDEELTMGEAWYAVAPMGWQRIDEPSNICEHEETVALPR